MRLPLALVIAVAIASAALVAVARDERSSAGTGAVTLVGDSLDVGTAPYLRSELRGWDLDEHDRVGRTTAEGVDVLRDLGPASAPIVVVSLGTNDAEGTETDFRRLVDEALQLAGARCVVWATVVRDGESRAGFNDVLAEAAATHRTLHLVDWASLVAADPSLLAGDLVHGSPFGYARRAQETARVVRECAR